MGNSGGKKREITPLHKRGKSFHVLQITEWHFHLRTCSQAHMYCMNMNCPVSVDAASSLFHTLFHSQSLTHPPTRAYAPVRALVLADQIQAYENVKGRIDFWRW